ncbi:MAG TPA: hypothetical protein VFQ25_09500 [Ktedonobacterales bacterium]|nr:hypothetical protein [Ktedonobacterales bacterium]
MAIAFGAFEPLPAYESVRTIFHLFMDAKGDREMLRRYSQERDVLTLSLQTEQGQAFTTNWVHIYDYDDLGRELEVQTADPAFWEDSRASQ